MSWGKGITISFVTFAVFIGSLVAVCVRQDINLVSKDYYNEELKYQDQIDQLNNAAALTAKPSVLVHAGLLELRMGVISNFEDGVLVLTRPSDVQYDAKFSFNAAGDSVRMFDLSGLPAGRYNTTLRWKMNGREFLIRESISL
jgi:hypothetical protein